ncbi:hypothetical protein [Flavobacterium hydrophilum]|uniref:Leucine-rich repeat domain-containing protein n=1 Tax=Flavobacterium hydrophilum TaxID=2211445 RepID=A0A2V4C5Z2_9FLAO|nr:hypothetical protein [Flavobacterium hydrophilum]PXY46082.1 hypothetical protein DMB68_02525 [Flavobacterium hydrophilum]
MEEGFQKAKGRNKILIHKRLGEVEIEQIKKHKNCPEIGLWYIKNKNLEFLEFLQKLKVVELYGVHTTNFEALARIDTLENLFVNAIKNHEDLSFINQLSQIEELDLLYLPKLEKFPDLSNCKKLKRLRIWQCKKLTNIQALTLIPNLEKVEITDTPQAPEDLEFLIKAPNIKYVSGQFGGTKKNNLFEELLKKHGKEKYG